VISEILGMDGARWHELKHWGDLITGITPTPLSDEVAAATRRMVAGLEEYARETIAARRRAPRDDLVSDLVRAEVDGLALTDEEIVAFVFLLLPAGFETTTNLLSNAVLGFLERPDDFAALRADPSRIGAHVEEVLRHDPPVHGTARVATRDVDLGGTTIPRGALVLVNPGAANRDDDAFPDPDRFDPSRHSQGGVAFGHGIHFCLGAPLARMEAVLAVEALASRFRGFERVGEVTWNRSFLARGPARLPLRFLPA
jgi:cytochrome P450